jgi:hypothetical protein
MSKKVSLAFATNGNSGKYSLIIPRLTLQLSIVDYCKVGTTHEQMKKEFSHFRRVTSEEFARLQASARRIMGRTAQEHNRALLDNLTERASKEGGKKILELCDDDLGRALAEHIGRAAIRRSKERTNNKK